MRAVLLAVCATGLSCLLLASCSGRKERKELVEFAKIVESSKPEGEKLLERFDSLKKYKGKKSSKELENFAKELAQLIVDIDDFVKPVKTMNPRTEEIKKLRDEYLEVWTTLQDAMRMVLEVMLTRDPNLAASLQERLMKKSAAFQTAMSRFQTDYLILIRMHGVEFSELGLSPRAPVPASFTPSHSESP